MDAMMSMMQIVKAFKDKNFEDAVMGLPTVAAGGAMAGLIAVQMDKPGKTLIVKSFGLSKIMLELSQGEPHPESLAGVMIKAFQDGDVEEFFRLYCVALMGGEDELMEFLKKSLKDPEWGNLEENQPVRRLGSCCSFVINMVCV